MRNRPRAALMALLGALLALALAAAMTAGAYGIGLPDIWAILAGHLTGNGGSGVPKVQDVIVWKIRAPRLILAAVSGMALAVAGAAYQGCFRNPLVEPYTLGVSSGAACGAALAVLFPSVFLSVPLAAFLFALAAVAVTGLLASGRDAPPPVVLVLTGIIVGALFSAGVGLLKYLAADTQLREITFWMMGGFHYASWTDAERTAMLVLPGMACIWMFGWRLNVLSLGSDDARSLGVNPTVTRAVLVVLATVCAAACVAAAGIIAWVGLMAPHAARMLFGTDNRWVIPGSALMGAVYLLVCDTLARTLTQAEIPVGIITSVLGAPYLVWLLRAKGRELYVG